VLRPHLKGYNKVFCDAYRWRIPLSEVKSMKRKKVYQFS
jgi:hypothetical protein